MTAFSQHDIYALAMPYFGDRGFTLYADANQFRRHHKTGFSNIIFNLTNYEEGALVEVQCGARHHQIEQMVAPFLQFSPDTLVHSMTLTINIGFFDGGKNTLRYSVKTHDDLKDVIDSVIATVEKSVYDYWVQYASLREIDKAFNDTPLQKCLLTPNQINRCFRGVAAAVLSFRERRDELFHLYDQWLQQKNTPDAVMERFRKFTLYLQHLSLN